jgi:hypothetical protein
LGTNVLYSKEKGEKTKENTKKEVTRGGGGIRHGS